MKQNLCQVEGRGREETRRSISENASLRKYLSSDKKDILELTKWRRGE